MSVGLRAAELPGERSVSGWHQCHISPSDERPWGVVVWRRQQRVLTACRCPGRILALARRGRGAFVDVNSLRARWAELTGQVMDRAQVASIPRGRTWLVVLGVWGTVAFGASGASASGVVCAACSGTYTGSWSAQIQNVTPEGTATYGMSLSWTEMLTTPTGGNGASGVWSLASAQGTVTFTNSASPSDDCSASLTPNLALAGDITQFGPAVSEGPSAITVSADLPTYWSGDPTQTPEPLVSSDNTHPGCCFTNELAYDSGFWTGFSGSSCYYAEAMSFPLGTSTTITDNCDGEGSDNLGATGTATLKSQLTLSPGSSSCALPAGVRGAHAARRIGARAASGGSLSANVTGLPRRFTGQTSLLAISAGDGRIVAARALARGATRTVLSLPSDRYAVLADAESPAGRSHNHDGIGPLVAVHPGRRATVRVALGRPAVAADVVRSRPCRGAGNQVILASGNRSRSPPRYRARSSP